MNTKEIKQSFQQKGNLYPFCITITYLLLFLWTKRIYLQDYPVWLYDSLLAYLKLFGKEALSTFQLKPYPVPNSLFQFLVMLLIPITSSIEIAAKIVTLTYLASFSWVCAKLIYVYENKFNWAKWTLLTSSFVVSSSFWNGNMNFQLGFLIFAYFLYKEKTQKLSLFQILTLSVLLFFAHGIFYGFFVLWCLYVIGIAQKKIATLAILLPSILLNIWYVLGRYFLMTSVDGISPESPIGSSLFQFIFYKAYTLLKLGPFNNFIGIDSLSFLENKPFLYFALMSLQFLYISILTLTVVLSLFKVLKATGNIDEKKKILLFLVLGSTFILFPPNLFGIVNIGERILAASIFALLIFLKLNPKATAFAAIIALSFHVYNFTYLYSAKNISGSVLSENNVTKQKYFNHHPYLHHEAYTSMDQKSYHSALFGTGLVVNKK